MVVAGTPTVKCVTSTAKPVVGALSQAKVSNVDTVLTVAAITVTRSITQPRDLTRNSVKIRSTFVMSVVRKTI